MRSVLGFALTLLLAPAIGHATDANLDPSFGSFGWTSLNDGPGWDSGDDVAVQPDGRIVVRDGPRGPATRLLMPDRV